MTDPIFAIALHNIIRNDKRELNNGFQRSTNDKIRQHNVEVVLICWNLDFFLK